MTFLKKITARTLIAALSLAILPVLTGQISDADFESIFSRLNGDDYDARYAARMDLQDHVSAASAPGNEEQQPIVEQQLLDRLSSEPLLTTKLWLLRQLGSIGSEVSLPALKVLLDSKDVELAEGAQQAIDRIVPTVSPKPGFFADLGVDELEDIARNSANRSERFMAFSLLANKKAKIAAAVMAEAGPSAPDFIRAAMLGSNSNLRKQALSQLANSDVSHQIAVIAALDPKAPSSVEKTLLELLATDNETLELQTIEALGRIGSVRSLDALLERIESRSRDVRDAAVDALASIADQKIDSNLRKQLADGEKEERVMALKALSLRASPGVNELVNTYAADESVDHELREEAIANMELVGDVDSFPILIDIVVNGEASGLRRDAQKSLKRMSLRLADPDAAWNAFAAGFEASKGDLDTQLALMLVSDSAPSKDAIDYLESAWATNEPRIQKMVLRVLPTWRNWDAGFALLELAKAADGDSELESQCYKGVGKLILGSDATFPLESKFKLAGAALEQAQTPADRQSVIEGFRYSTWRERVHVTYNEVDPELKEAVLAYAKN
ncbi:HEAT repeat domain-containing protein [Pelagicoccus sp. SDUM812002]|uniref:HEAT repeat domain-containing protein n=1 Tax=Pelagicoccus sp. SDUM812002 TaxID=3041266 RepID=UPI00280C57F4|nr:HEAT repeat domain-containing protein [Pelagicoccus sp. SDUM812002]MDQ8187749.1 HEAT repeat domain-containing protein [Pelagicoccus sp. SDUM812002]